MTVQKLSLHPLWWGWCHFPFNSNLNHPVSYFLKTVSETEKPITETSFNTNPQGRRLEWMMSLEV